MIKNCGIYYKYCTYTCYDSIAAKLLEKACINTPENIVFNITAINPLNVK